MHRVLVFLKNNGWLLLASAVLLPFLLLRLLPDMETRTVSALWAPEHGWRFISGLWVLALVLALGVAWGRLGQRIPTFKNLKVSMHPALLGVGIGLGVLAIFFLPIKWLGLLSQMGIYMILALGLNIAVGITGLFVLGYAGFFLFGAYVFGVLQSQWLFLSWWMVLPLSFVLGSALGWVVGLPCLKLRGDYLALVTLGFAESIRELCRNLPSLTGGDQGMVIRWEAKFNGFGFLTSHQQGALVIAGLVVLGVVTIARLMKSKIGRAWLAVREDELAASAVGIPVVKMKLSAFALSAGYASVAGVCYASYVGFIDPAMGAFDQSVLVLAMVILGGVGSVAGSLLGAFLLFMMPTMLRDYVPQVADYRLLMFGALMVAMMVWRPQGLLGDKSLAKGKSS